MLISKNLAYINGIEDKELLSRVTTAFEENFSNARVNNSGLRVFSERQVLANSESGYAHSIKVNKIPLATSESLQFEFFDTHWFDIGLKSNVRDFSSENIELVLPPWKMVKQETPQEALIEAQAYTQSLFELKKGYVEIHNLVSEFCKEINPEKLNDPVFIDVVNKAKQGAKTWQSSEFTMGYDAKSSHFVHKSIDQCKSITQDYPDRISSDVAPDPLFCIINGQTPWAKQSTGKSSDCIEDRLYKALKIVANSPSISSADRIFSAQAGEHASNLKNGLYDPYVVAALVISENTGLALNHTKSMDLGTAGLLKNSNSRRIWDANYYKVLESYLKSTGSSETVEKVKADSSRSLSKFDTLKKKRKEPSM